MTKTKKKKTKPKGFYRDTKGRTRPITGKNVGAALAKGVVIKRVVDSEGQAVQLRKGPPVYELRTPRNKAVWVAHITGPDDQYRFERHFLNDYDVDTKTEQRIYYLQEGIYEFNYPGNKRTFIRVKNGEATKVSRRTVEKLYPKQPRF